MLKIFGVFLLLFVMLFLLVVSLDLIAGHSLKTSMYYAINPFKIMEVAEYLIIAFTVVYYLAKITRAIIQKKKKESQPQQQEHPGQAPSSQPQQ